MFLNSIDSLPARPNGVWLDFRCPRVWLWRVFAVAIMIGMPLQLQVGACTGFIISGEASAGQPMLCKVRDATSWREGVALVTPDDGYKLIVIQSDYGVRRSGYGGAALSGLNERGVGAATYAASSNHRSDRGPTPAPICAMILKQADSAEAYVRIFGGLVKERGVRAARAGGISGAVDPREAWRIEYTGTFYGIEGPFGDGFSAIANMYQNASMMPHCTAPAGRRPRQAMATELLREGTRESPWDLQKAFAFSRNQEHPGSPGRPICYSRVPTGDPDAGGTVSGHIVVPDARHPDLLSVLWWSPDMPVLAPYIPLHIGVTELPPEIDASADFVMADTFRRLRERAFADAAHWDRVTREWNEFETAQWDRVRALEKEIRRLADQGNRPGAESRLNEFLRQQVEEVMKRANEMLASFEE